MQAITSTERIYNFSAGPAMLPLPVLEQAQRELIALPDIGMSVLEVSHRSNVFEEILRNAIDDMRELASVGPEYKILMLQGGASLQFSMVPMNLMGPEMTADYIDTGSWSQKAIKEGQRVGRVHIAASTKEDHYRRLPRPDEINLTPDARYVHITGNNTIEGTQWKTLPPVGNVPLVSDASSELFSKPIDVTDFGLIYAGAQKNLGPSGVTVVIIREDLLTRAPDTLPTLLNYRTHAASGSLYHTPPTFGIYVLGLTMKWLRSAGGLEAIQSLNERKAAKLYAEIDRTGFYQAVADAQDRSLMNVTFRLGTEELEARFVDQATAAGLDGLRGHRSVGGLRASIYNAFPEAGVDALVDFMRDFEQRNG